MMILFGVVLFQGEESLQAEPKDGESFHAAKSQVGLLRRLVDLGALFLFNMENKQIGIPWKSKSMGGERLPHAKKRE